MVTLILCLYVLAAWFVCSAVLTGIGSLVLRRLFSSYSAWLAFWCGLAVSVAALETYQLFFAIGPFIGLLLILAGIYGLVTNRQPLMQALRSWLFSRMWVVVANFVVLIVLAIRAAGPCEHFDTGLYGASAVRWIVSYPAVPGLANLHGRLGFQSGVFLFVAALQQGPFHAIAFRVLVGLLIFVAFLKATAAAERLLRETSSDVANWFLVLLLIPLISWVGRADVVGTNTDIPATIVTLLAVWQLFAALGQMGEGHDTDKSSEQLFAAMALFSLAVVFKLSVVALCGLGWIGAFAALRLLALPTRRKKLVALAGALLSASLLVPYLIRGILLSGYPLYPSSLFGMPVDWRLPVESLTKVRLGVRAWARMPHASLSETAGTVWIRGWFNSVLHNREGFLIPAGIAAVGALIVLIRLSKSRSTVPRKQILLLIPSVAGLAFWFINAPALRFGESAIWSTACVLGALGVSLIVRNPNAIWKRAAILMTLVLCLWSLYPRSLWESSFERPLTTEQFAPLPAEQTTVRKNSSGLAVRVPSVGNQCWDAPLPCTAYFNESLRLRHTGQLGGGFYSADLPKDAEWIGEDQQ